MRRIKENVPSDPYSGKEVFNVEALGVMLRKLDSIIRSMSSMYSHMDETVGYVRVSEDEFGQNIMESYEAAYSDCMRALKSLTRAQSTLKYLESDLDSLDWEE